MGRLMTDTLASQNWLLGEAFAHSEGKTHSKAFCKLDTPCPYNWGQYDPLSASGLTSGVNFSGLRGIQNKAVARGQSAHVGTQPSAGAGSTRTEESWPLPYS